MRELKAIYSKGEVTMDVLVVDVVLNANGDKEVIFIDVDSKIDSDEHQYFTIKENTRD